jgi:hypothetical protein
VGGVRAQRRSDYFDIFKVTRSNIIFVVELSLTISIYYYYFIVIICYMLVCPTLGALLSPIIVMRPFLK